MTSCRSPRVGRTAICTNSKPRRAPRLRAQLGDLEKRDERRFSLAEIAPRDKAWFIYEYDFGDGWEHEVKVEKILPCEAGETAASCLQGKNACPPEDCGGIPGYYHLLEVIANPQHREHKDLTEWLGSDFDPHHFDPAEINPSLKRLKI